MAKILIRCQILNLWQSTNKTLCTKYLQNHYVQIWNNFPKKSNFLSLLDSSSLTTDPPTSHKSQAARVGDSIRWGRRIRFPGPHNSPTCRRRAADGRGADFEPSSPSSETRDVPSRPAGWLSSHSAPGSIPSPPSRKGTRVRSRIPLARSPPPRRSL